MKKKIVIILTSGRSGSSILAKFFECFEFSTGKNLYINPYISYIKKSNPKGHFENIYLLGANEYLLFKNKLTWFSIKKDLTVVDTKILKKTIKQILSNKNTNILLKDPRMAHLAYLWHKEFIKDGVEPLYVYLHRKPQEYIDSLRKRDSLSKEESEGLWLSDNFSILNFLEDKKFLSIDFKDLVNNKNMILRHISDFLKLPPNEKKIYSFEKFFDQSLIRSANKNFLVSDETNNLYSDIKKLSSQNNGSKLTTKRKNEIKACIDCLDKRQKSKMIYKIKRLLYFLKYRIRPFYSNHKIFK